jgi:transcriptional regulator with XRE-family HTH domain
MNEPKAPAKLKSWRKENGLTVRQAAARIVVNGQPADGSTWHNWESGKKKPLEPWMVELERVTGVQPNDFYPRPDAGQVGTEQLAA